MSKETKKWDVHIILLESMQELLGSNFILFLTKNMDRIIISFFWHIRLDWNHDLSKS